MGAIAGASACAPTPKRPGSGPQENRPSGVHGAPTAIRLEERYPTTDADLDTLIGMQFNVPVDVRSVKERLSVHEKATGLKVQVFPHDSGFPKVAEFFVNSLKPGTLYEVVISSGVRSRDGGLVMDQEESWTFTTRDPSGDSGALPGPPGRASPDGGFAARREPSSSS